MMKKLIAAILMLPTVALGSDVTIPNEFTAGTTAVASQVNANFDAVETAIDENDGRLDDITSTVYHVDPSASGNDSGIQEAIDACKDGTGSINSDRCVVQLPCTDSGGLTTDGLTMSDMEGIAFRGCGSGTTSSAATYIKFAGTAGGTVLSLDNVRQFDIENVHIDCDGASADAGIGIQLLRTGSIVTQFGSFRNVTVSNCTDVAIKNGPTGANSQQIDSIKFDLVRMRNSAKCYYQASSQSVHIRFDTGECTGATSSPGFDIVAGEFIYENGFGKTPEASSGMVLFDIDELALVHIENNRFEIYGTTPTVISSTDGEGTRDTNTIRGNFFNIQTPGATCIDWNRRGHLWVESNGFGGFNSGSNEGCVLSAQSTVGSAGNKFLDVHSYGNSHRGVWEAADFGGSIDYSRLLWTIGTDTTLYEDGRIGGADKAVVGGDIGAATATSPSADDNDTSVATTAFVQGEINGAGGTDLTCSSGVCNVDAAVTRDADLAAYTTGTSTPVDGSTACNTGDMHLETDAFKIYFCVDGSTDKWYGVALSDTP